MWDDIKILDCLIAYAFTIYCYFNTDLFVKNLEVLLLIVEHLFVQFRIPSVGVCHGSEGIVERAIEV